MIDPKTGMPRKRGRPRKERPTEPITWPEKAVPVNACCDRCRFYLSRGDDGICRESPVFVQHRPKDWCGKYQQKKENSNG